VQHIQSVSIYKRHQNRLKPVELAAGKTTKSIKMQNDAQKKEQ